jgi:hypothetical protein
MPRGIISGQAARRFTGGVTELEVGANNFRRMILEGLVTGIGIERGRPAG